MRYRKTLQTEFLVLIGSMILDTDIIFSMKAAEPVFEVLFFYDDNLAENCAGSHPNLSYFPYVSSHDFFMLPKLKATIQNSILQ